MSASVTVRGSGVASESYAPALGVRLGSVIRVSEPEEALSFGGRAAASRSFLASESDAAEVVVDAGELEVAATVQVKFCLEQD